MLKLCIDHFSGRLSLHFVFDKGFFDVAVDLLKRHLGIVWDPGRFAVLLRGFMGLDAGLERLRERLGTR